MSSPGVDFEACQALKDIQQIACENGTKITLNVRGETDIKRDKLQSITRRDKGLEVVLHCYPLNYSPTTYDLQKAGLKENSRAIAYVPTQDITDAGLSFNDIEIHRSTIQTSLGRYEIVDKALIGQIGNEFLQTTFGLSKL